MKLSKGELKKIEEFRAKILAARVRDVVQLLEDMGYDTMNIETLKRQLESGRTASPELFEKG